MTTKVSENKLDELERLDQDKELEVYLSFAKMIAGKYQSLDHDWMMNFDDLVGEMLVEVSKGIMVYADKPLEERIAIIKRMMVNRVKELKHRMFLTFRGQEVGSVSLDADENEDIVPAVENPDNIFHSRERVIETLSRLSPTAKEVLEAVVFGNNRLNSIMKLAAIRKEQTKYVQLKVRSIYVADALLMPVPVVNRAFKEIRDTYAAVCVDLEY